jgi:hypothetical protein
MKKLILILATFFLTSISFARVITAVASGSWNSNSIWNPATQPQDADTIIIPAATSVTISSMISLNSVIVKVYGTLKFSSAILAMDNNSSIYVYYGGKITGNGSSSEQLRIGNNKIWLGTDPAVSGPEMATQLTGGFIPFGIVLPVKFIGFSLTISDKNVFVQWSTSEELNAYIYQVERSVDGNNWNAIANVTAAGNSSTVHNYSYTDKNQAANILYYRVKEIDGNGKYTYTAIKSIRRDSNNTGITIASIESRVILQFPSQVKGQLVVRLVSPGGQVMDQKVITNAFGQVILDTRMKGDCIVSLSNGQEINLARQVIL